MDHAESMTKFKHADTLYREGKYSEALALLEELNRAKPNEKNILFPAALCLEKLGHGQQALNLCEQLITQHHDPRAQELKARLVPQTAPEIPGIVIPDIDLDYHPPAARVSQIPRESGKEPLWIGGFVLLSLTIFALATYFRYLWYVQMYVLTTATDENAKLVSLGKYFSYAILGGEFATLLAGFAAAYAALKITDQFTYASFVDNAKDVIRCVVLCQLIMCTCIGIFFVPWFLKKRYDMSVGKLIASIGIYVFVSLVGVWGVNVGSDFLIFRIKSEEMSAIGKRINDLEKRQIEGQQSNSNSQNFIGAPAPQLHVATWVKGQPVDVTKGKGAKVYVVEFWATWCPPCRVSIPHLSELQAKYKDKGLVVIGVSNEELGEVQPFVQNMGSDMNYTVAVDQDRQTSAAYMGAVGANSIPHAFIVDKQGKVVWHGHPMDNLEYELARVL